MISVSFLFFSFLYPLNLHIFTFLFVRSQYKNVQFTIRLLSTIFSCFLLSLYLEFVPSLRISIYLLKYGFIALLPFILPLCLNGNGNEEEDADEDVYESERLGVSVRNLKIRNYFLAPLIEEFYFRLLLPNLNTSVLLLSIAFSLAHAHPLLFPRNWNQDDIRALSGQCLISFVFGLVCNLIRIKIGLENNNIWMLLVLTLVHGVANYTGVPVIIFRNQMMTGLQIILLILSIVFIVFI